MPCAWRRCDRDGEAWLNKVASFADTAERYRCRVCGYDCYPHLPWGANGAVPSYEICPCCGVEFGYDDDGYDVCVRRRRHWVQVEACKWFMPKMLPDDWHAGAQLRRLPTAFRNKADSELALEADKLSAR